MRSPLTLLALTLIALAPSCFVARNQINTPIEAATLDQLVPGTSTADDVLDVLGAPADVVQLGRRSAWRYDHTHEKRAAFTLLVVTMVNSDAKSDRVWVFFDEEDRLIHVRGTFEADEAEYKLPFQD